METETQLKQHITSPTGVRLLVIGMPADAYRFTLVQNPELKGRYGNLEYTSHDTGMEYKMKIDGIEKYSILGAVEKARGCNSGVEIRFLELGRLVESMSWPDFNRRELYYRDYLPTKNILGDYYLMNPDSSLITFLASKGIHVDSPYSKSNGVEKKIHDKLLILERRL